MILTAAWVVPVGSPPIRDGAVVIEGQRIAAVGRAVELATGSQPATDLGDAILTPGLINPHAHLELTCYAGLLKPAPFWDWIPELVKLRRAPGQIEREQEGVRAGVRQSLRAGVTCVGDISRRNLNWRILKDAPIRKVCFVELLTLADQPPRNLDELRAAVAEIEEDSLLTAGLTPHTPFTVPESDIRATLELAAELRRPWCTHWAETREELAFLRGESDALPPFMRKLLEQCDLRSPRASAIELLERCCQGQPPGTLAHFNYTQPGDADRLATAGHTVVYCPRSHDFFGHRDHPFRALLAAGVNVAIGTDSAASNDSLALLDELRFVRQHVPDSPAARVLLEMVTLNAARALGLADQIGSLEPGKLADLAAFTCPNVHDDPITTLLDSAPRASQVWVAGRQVS